MTLTDAPDLLTVEEAAKLLRIGRGTAYAAINTNELPHVRIGRRILVPKAALIERLRGAV